MTLIPNRENAEAYASGYEAGVGAAKNVGSLIELTLRAKLLEIAEEIDLRRNAASDRCDESTDGEMRALQLGRYNEANEISQLLRQHAEVASSEGSPSPAEPPAPIELLKCPECCGPLFKHPDREFSVCCMACKLEFWTKAGEEARAKRQKKVNEEFERELHGIRRRAYDLKSELESGVTIFYPGHDREES